MRLNYLLLLIALAATARADLFVSSFSQHSVRRYDDSGNFLSTFVAAGSGGLNAPHRGIFLPDGNFYVASASNDRILRYNGQTGAFIDVFIQNGANGLPASTLDYPVDLVLGPDGALYISSQVNDSILRFNATTGAFIDTFVTSGSGGLDGPSGIQFFGGDLFVAGRFSSRAYRYDGTTGAFELEIGNGVLNTAYGLDFGPDGNLYVASGGNSSVFKFDPVTGVNLLGGTTAFVNTPGPIGIEFGPGNDLYVANLGAGTVKRYDGTTRAAEPDFVTAGSGGLAQPNFMTFAVPEPGTGLLLGTALAGFAGRRMRGAMRSRN